MRPPPREETNDLPDLTPMIDIVFLLIVFFMTVANMQVRELIPIEVPIADKATVPEDRGLRMTVSLQADGSLFVGPQAVAPEDLPAYLGELRASAGDRVKVYVRADARVPFKEIREVFAAAAASGISDVVFATYQSDK